MNITFYVLNKPQTISSSDELEVAFLTFVCKLTKTVLHKSNKTLIILDDDHNRLAMLDALLWSFSTTDFIPHDLCINSLDKSNTTNSAAITDSIAPVILTNNLPTNFDGVVLNLATQPLALPSLSASTSALHQPDDSFDTPHRLLEIIPADDINKQKGRDKYQCYRNLGYQLDLHTIG